MASASPGVPGARAVRDEHSVFGLFQLAVICRKLIREHERAAR